MKAKSIKRIKTEEENAKMRQILFKVSLSIFFVSLFFVAFMLGNGFLYFHNNGYVDAFNNYDFQFHVINVGQGDCFLIKLPDRKVLLVDSGESENYAIVKGYINEFFKKEKLSRIDYFVLTHQDADHIGSADKILNNFDVGLVFRPKVFSPYEQEMGLADNSYQIFNTEDFNNFTISLHENNVHYKFNEKGITISGSGYNLEFLSPENDNYTASNDYSAVIMLTAKGKKFLLTGDATSNIEDTLIREYGENLKSDVLKISHHGSKTSSSEDFLSKVNASFAILSVGENNSGLPNVEILNRLYAQNCTIYSTKKLGCFALSVENNQIIMRSQPVLNKDLPLMASLTILAVCFVWGINFQRKPLRKDANMIVENSKI